MIVPSLNARHSLAPSHQTKTQKQRLIREGGKGVNEMFCSFNMEWFRGIAAFFLNGWLLAENVTA